MFCMCLLCQIRFAWVDAIWALLNMLQSISWICWLVRLNRRFQNFLAFRIQWWLYMCVWIFFVFVFPSIHTLHNSQSSFEYSIFGTPCLLMWFQYRVASLSASIFVRAHISSFFFCFFLSWWPPLTHLNSHSIGLSRIAFCIWYSKSYEFHRLEMIHPPSTAWIAPLQSHPKVTLPALILFLRQIALIPPSSAG